MAVVRDYVVTGVRAAQYDIRNRNGLVFAGVLVVERARRTGNGQRVAVQLAGKGRARADHGRNVACVVVSACYRQARYLYGDRRDGSRRGALASRLDGIVDGGGAAQRQSPERNGFVFTDVLIVERTRRGDGQTFSIHDPTIRDAAVNERCIGIAVVSFVFGGDTADGDLFPVDIRSRLGLLSQRRKDVVACVVAAKRQIADGNVDRVLGRILIRKRTRCRDRQVVAVHESFKVHVAIIERRRGIAVIGFAFGENIGYDDLFYGYVRRHGLLAVVNGNNVVLAVIAVQLPVADGNGLARSNVLIVERTRRRDGNDVARNDAHYLHTAIDERRFRVAVVRLVRGGDTADGKRFSCDRERIVIAHAALIVGGLRDRNVNIVFARLRRHRRLVVVAVLAVPEGGRSVAEVSADNGRARLASVRPAGERHTRRDRRFCDREVRRCGSAGAVACSFVRHSDGIIADVGGDRRRVRRVGCVFYFILHGPLIVRPVVDGVIVRRRVRSIAVSPTVDRYRVERRLHDREIARKTGRGQNVVAVADAGHRRGVSRTDVGLLTRNGQLHLVSEKNARRRCGRSLRLPVVGQRGIFP